MNKVELLNEYQSLEREYSQFLLHLSIPEDLETQMFVLLTTFEEVTANILLGSQGWQVVDISYPEKLVTKPVTAGDIFETSESLLMTLSPRFCNLWNSRLESKLAQLENLRASPDHDLEFN